MAVSAINVIKRAWRATLALMLTGVSVGFSEKSRYLNGRRRANSTATNNSRGTSPRPSTARSGHSRASSEFSAVLLKDHPQGAQSHGGSGQARLPRSPIAGQLSQLSIPHSAPHLTLTTSSPMSDVLSVSPILQTSGRQLPISKARDSFLDMDDDASIKDPDDIPILEREGTMLEEGLRDDVVGDDDKKPTRAVAVGFTWDELVDRLLQEKMSKADSNFVTVFLCFYRKISPPKELLKSILERFEKANSGKILLQKINTQLRYCMILNQWVADHPGDFAHPKTRQKFTAFLNSISSNRTFAFLTREMQQNLLNTTDDEDAMWGKADSDYDFDKDGRKSSFMANAFPDPPKVNSEIKAPGGANLTIARCDTERRASDVSNLIPGEPSQYTRFMATPNEDITNELTRIDWGEFSQIRPRDLVRHVSTSPEQRDKSKSLVHVSRMISHFNHVAFWVSTIILEKEKPKHRARALEKFMEIAWVIDASRGRAESIKDRADMI